MRLVAMVSCVLLTSAVVIGSQPQAAAPGLSETDQVRLAEAFRLADKIGNKIWPNWDKAPFGVLLVTPEHEYLLNQAQAPDDFKLLSEDPVLKQKVWHRPRKFNPAFLATFPVVGSMPTIVIGQAENTEAKTSSRWVITLLHEHFHQLQYSQPRYYVDVNELGLAKGDQSGMWMLNYAFPYGTTEVQDQLRLVARNVAAALAARGKADFDAKVAAYRQAKEKLRTMVSAEDYKYLNFQLWQEGVARYTEYHLAKLAATDYEPAPAFRALKDYEPYEAVAARLLGNVEKELQDLQPARNKRTIVYNFGAAEALLLDTVQPEWRKRYFEEKFSLDKHFDKR